MPEKSKTYEKFAPRVFIRTFGCQMNERDSEIIASLMMDEGYVPVFSADEADLIIFNTCSVRRHAEDRAWGNLGELKKLKERDCPQRLRNSKMGTVPIIGLVGCMGKAYGKKIFERLPHVDFVCGPANIYDIPSLVEKVKDGKRHPVAIDEEKRPVIRDAGRYRTEKVRAFVNISEGCNNFCSYCIVPYVRGSEVSRPAQDILDEISQLVDNGTKEVMLLGQNVNSYKNDDIDFVRLLQMTNDVKGLERIRFMTSHPKDASINLFKAMSQLDKVCEHLHLPLQSGSDRILKLMDRNYNVSHYLKLIEDLRKEIPDCAITTDIIVGFPSETEEDFKETYMLMKKIEFNGAFIFKYSPRPFTKAAKINDDVPKEVKEERNQILLDVQDKITRRKCDGLVGTSQQALGLTRAKRKPNFTSSDNSGFYLKGRTRTNYQVVYKGDKGLIGAVSDVKIEDVDEHTLIGEIV